ncbi:BTAD domain-containing putative transcriptional regulator [Nocardiopsis sp. FR26]|uniref:AfsR/SARP family transcriptional regulator n=1 Tax=unclassified Nocardiopsis TaxID=2649073 RepID=UPI00351A5920
MALSDPAGRRRDADAARRTTAARQDTRTRRTAVSRTGTAAPTARGLRVGLLGHFGVETDGGPVRLRGDKRRAMLATLLLHAGRTVSTADLIERIWAAPPSPAARSALQVHVARLRAVLDDHCGTPLIAGADGGYRIDLDEEECDLLRFRSLVRGAAEAAYRGDPDTRADLLIQALGLWRGPVLADVASPVLHERDVAPLTEELLRAAESGFGAALARGDHERVADQIGPVAADHPEREPLIRVQMLALYRSGRPSEALRVYARTRRVLAERLGADPGRELQETFHGILRGDLDRPPRTAPVPRQRDSVEGAAQGAGADRAGGPVPGARPAPVHPPEPIPLPPAPAELPAAPPALVGREEALAELDRLAGPRGSAPVSVLVRGPAGAGTSALALSWAHAVAPHFPDGQVYVDLRGGDGAARDPAEVLRRLVRSLSSEPGEGGADAEESAARLRTLLARRRVLFVLDNASSTRQVRPLLPGGTGCAAVVTSRCWLTDLLVRDGLRALPVGPLPPGAAVELLRAHAGPDRCTEPVLRRLAHLAGFLPLALRMAAVWLETHPQRSAVELVRRLEAVDPARGGTPTARMAAVLRAGPEEGRHGRGEVPAAPDPPEPSVGHASYVRLSPR